MMRRVLSARSDHSISSAIACVVSTAIPLLVPSSSLGEIIVSPGFPNIQSAGTLYGIRYQYNMIEDVYGDALQEIQHGSNSMFPTETADINLVLPITAYDLQGSSGGSAGANVFGSVANGVLKVFGHTYVKQALTHSEAYVTFDMIDRIHIDTSGQPNFALGISGIVISDYVDVNNYGNARGTADFYVWPASDGIPAAGQPLNTVYHTQHSITSGGDSSYTTTDPTRANYDAGTDWWIAARMEVWSASNCYNTPFGVDPSFEGTGDFSNTISVHIGADPSTPDFSYTAASGIDYRSNVPDPAVAPLLVFFAGVLARPRRG